MRRVTKLPRMLVFAAVVLLIPHTASAQAWTFDFSADEIRLSSEGYRSAREIGERVRAEPGLWEADIELESVRDTASLDGRDVWRLRAVVLELTEQDVLLPHVDQAALVFAETTPPFGPAASPARIVVRIRRLQDDPLRLFHRHEPIVRFATGSTEVSHCFAVTS